MSKVIILFALFSIALTAVDFGVDQIETPTPHIKAKFGDFAKTVLMPGDPKRANYIATKFLKDAKLVNDVRGVQGYTGTYKGKRVSVMASGMGIPSISIYSYELFRGYGVDNIIRVGSAGSIQERINVKDIVVATGASTNSNVGSNYNLPGVISGVADYHLVIHTYETAKKLGLDKKVKFGQVFTGDSFYTDKHESDLEWAKMGIVGVEMEAYGLYLQAARAGKRALAICTISDSIITNEHLTADERQLSFDEMIILALETAITLE